MTKNLNYNLDIRTKGNLSSGDCKILDKIAPVVRSEYDNYVEDLISAVIMF